MSQRKIQPKNPTHTDSSTPDARVRNFATLIYPSKDEYEAYYATHKTWMDKETGEILEFEHYDGADGYGSPPEDWRERIIQMHVMALISPMHIGDHNPDGKLKKPHYHVMFIFEGKKSYETQIKPLFDQIGGVGREEVASMRGYARYMLHMDNPEKQPYEQDDITAYGGADFETIIRLPGDTMKAFRDITDFITRNDIYGYAELVDALRVHSPELEEAAVMKLTYPLIKYLKSRSWEATNNYKRADTADNTAGKEGTNGNTDQGTNS